MSAQTEMDEVITIFRDMVKTEIESIYRFLGESRKEFRLIGGWHFSEEWNPFMSAIMDVLQQYINRIQAGQVTTEEDMRATSNGIREIRRCIQDKNDLLCAKIQHRERHKNEFFEPIESMLFRRLGDIVQLNNACNIIDHSNSPSYSKNLMEDREKQMEFVQFGRRVLLSVTSTSDIFTLMPEIASIHLKSIIKYTELKEHEPVFGIDPLPEVDYVKPEEEGQKRIKEIISLMNFLVRHGYPESWRASVRRKMINFQQSFERGEYNMQFRYAMNFVEQHYCRLFKAKKMILGQIPMSETWLAAERDRCLMSHTD